MIKHERYLFVGELIKLLNLEYEPIFFDQSPSLERDLLNCKHNKESNHILSDNVYNKFKNVSLLLACSKSEIIT